MDSRDTKKLKEHTEELMEAISLVGVEFKGNQFQGGTPEIGPGHTKAAMRTSTNRRAAKQDKSMTMHGKLVEAARLKIGTGKSIGIGAATGIGGSAVVAPKATENAFDKGLGAAQEWGKENIAPIRNKIDSGLSRIADPVAEVIPDAVKSTLSAGTKKVRDFFNTDKNMPSSDEIGKNLAQKKDNFSKLTPAQQKMVPSSVRRSLSNATPENTEARLKGAATVADIASYAHPAMRLGTIKKIPIITPGIGSIRMGSDAYGHAEKGQYTASALDAIPAVKGTFKSAIPTMVKGVVDPQSPDKDEDNSKPNVNVDDIFNPNKSEPKPNSVPTSSNKPSSSDIFGAPVGIVSKDDKTEKESGPTKNKKSLKETILAVRNAALNEFEIPYKPKIPAPKPKTPAPEVKPEAPKPEVVPEQPQPPQPGQDPALPKQVPTKKPGKKPKEEPAPSEEPAETPNEEPSKEPSKEPTKEPSKEPAETPDEKTSPKPSEEPGPGPKPAEEPKPELSNEKTPEKAPETKVKTKIPPIPIPFFGGGLSSLGAQYNWNKNHSNPWVTHRADKRRISEDFGPDNTRRKDSSKELVGRPDSAGVKDPKSVLARNATIKSKIIDEEKKLAGLVKSVIKKKKEEKEGGPNPLVDFEPKLNHKYDNEN